MLTLTSFQPQSADDPRLKAFIKQACSAKQALALRLSDDGGDLAMFQIFAKSPRQLELLRAAIAAAISLHARQNVTLRVEPDPPTSPPRRNL